jgi:hypothetical protein
MINCTSHILLEPSPGWLVKTVSQSVEQVKERKRGGGGGPIDEPIRYELADKRAKSLESPFHDISR